jgi:hypothetical protein
MADRQLVYLAHGSDSAAMEAKYSIVSAMAHATSELGVTVFTDRPAAFDKFPIRAEPLSAATFDEWTGPDKFVMRAKIFALMGAIDRAAKTLFMDADTLFLGAPETLFARIGRGRSVMHADEGALFDNPAQVAMTQ